MAKVKIQGNASGTGILTVTAPNTSTDRTITLPDGTGTLIADDGSGNVDVTGVGKFSLDNNGGAGGGIVASNTNASNPALGGYVDLMERGTAFGTDNNYGVRLYYDGSANKFHIQGGNETTVATHLTMVRDSGDITIDTGNLVIGTSGKGIDFSATSNGSGTMTSEVLDDYEEGTWTPASTAFTIGSIPSAKYTKIGRQVTVQVYIEITPNSGNANGVVISGLPFNVAGSGWSTGAVNMSDSNTVVDNLHVRAYANSGDINVKKNNDTTMVGTEIDAGHLVFTVTYFTA